MVFLDDEDLSMKKILMLVFALLPLAVQAQDVPALDKVSTTAVLPPQPVRLDPKDRRALDLAKEWKNSPDKPFRAEDGSVKYVYGATLPTIVCAVLRVCMIRLQEGEVIVDDIHAGDTKRWDILPVLIGPEGNQTTMVSVKAHEVGLVNNIVIPTNRRVYILQAKSTKHEWMPVLAFHYPEDAKKAWAEYRKKQDQIAYSSTLTTGESVSENDFEYRIEGESPWKPIRVYNNGTKTIIQFASSKFNHGAPAFVALSGDGGVFSDETTEVFNFRVVGDRYEVDGLPHSMALISGVGKGEKRVLIEYVGGKKQ